MTGIFELAITDVQNEERFFYMSKNDTPATLSVDLWLGPRIIELRQAAAALRDQANDKDKSADLLESELKAYLAANRDAAPPARSKPTPSAPTVAEPRKGGRQIMPGSKSDQIINLVKEAGARGLKVGEIMAAADARGLDIKPNSLRGLVWAQKQAGRFVAADDRYYTPENAPQ